MPKPSRRASPSEVEPSSSNPRRRNLYQRESSSYLLSLCPSRTSRLAQSWPGRQTRPARLHLSLTADSLSSLPTRSAATVSHSVQLCRHRTPALPPQADSGAAASDLRAESSCRRREERARDRPRRHGQRCGRRRASRASFDPACRATRADQSSRGICPPPPPPPPPPARSADGHASPPRVCQDPPHRHDRRRRHRSQRPPRASFFQLFPRRRLHHGLTPALCTFTGGAARPRGRPGHPQAHLRRPRCRLRALPEDGHGAPQGDGRHAQVRVHGRHVRRRLVALAQGRRLLVAHRRPPQGDGPVRQRPPRQERRGSRPAHGRHDHRAREHRVPRASSSSLILSRSPS